jgi:hypothetical protein
MPVGPLPGGFSVLVDPSSAAEERFAIVRMDDLLAPGSRISSAADSIAAFGRALAALPWCSEAEVRGQLATMGLDAAAIDERITAARRKLRVLTSGPTVYETLTRVGYRNADGQEVTGSTDRWSRAGQRVFVLRCTVCGHEYGAYGCDIDIRRCPACQDGPPGVPVS